MQKKRFISSYFQRFPAGFYYLAFNVKLLNSSENLLKMNFCTTCEKKERDLKAVFTFKKTLILCILTGTEIVRLNTQYLSFHRLKCFYKTATFTLHFIPILWQFVIKL